MVLAVIGIVVVLVLAVSVAMAVGAAAVLGRMFVDRRARIITGAIAGVGLTSGFALIAFELLVPLGVVLLFVGIAGFVGVCVQHSQPMGEPVAQAAAAGAGATQGSTTPIYRAAV